MKVCAVSTFSSQLAEDLHTLSSGQFSQSTPFAPGGNSGTSIKASFTCKKEEVN